MFRKDENNPARCGIEDSEIVKKILKHPGLWEIKQRPPPKATGQPKTPVATTISCGRIFLDTQPRFSYTYPSKSEFLSAQLDRPNQVWTTDITYIPMRPGFMYLTAVMDWYSRKILSFRLPNTLESEFCIEALEEAIRRYGKPDIFNIDQGSQFISRGFVRILESHGIQVSIDGRGRVQDNTFIERLWWTLKYHRLSSFMGPPPPTTTTAKIGIGIILQKMQLSRIYTLFSALTQQKRVFGLPAVFLFLWAWCSVSWAGSTFHMLVMPEYLEKNALRFYVYGTYKNSTVPVTDGTGEYEIFHEDGRPSGEAGALRFNRQRSRWETRIIDTSFLPKGEYYNMICIEDKSNQRVCKRLFFYVGYANKMKGGSLQDE